MSLTVVANDQLSHGIISCKDSSQCLLHKTHISNSNMYIGSASKRRFQSVFAKFADDIRVSIHIASDITGTDFVF